MASVLQIMILEKASDMCVVVGESSRTCKLNQEHRVEERKRQNGCTCVKYMRTLHPKSKVFLISWQSWGL